MIAKLVLVAIEDRKAVRTRVAMVAPPLSSGVPIWNAIGDRVFNNSVGVIFKVFIC
jgi:hypothetical protein